MDIGNPQMPIIQGMSEGCRLLMEGTGPIHYGVGTAGLMCVFVTGSALLLGGAATGEAERCGVRGVQGGV